MFALIGTLPSSGKVEAILVFALAAALSGWRMRDAFFGVCALMLVIVYVAVKWNDISMTMIVAAFCAVAAGVALRRQWKRPSTNALFAGLALAMPVTGYLATIAMRIFHTYVSSTIVAAILIATSIALLAIGYPGATACCSYPGRSRSARCRRGAGESWDRRGAKLIGMGLLLIAVAVSFSRALRDAENGLVIKPVRVRRTTKRCRSAAFSPSRRTRRLRRTTRADRISPTLQGQPINHSAVRARGLITNFESQNRFTRRRGGRGEGRTDRRCTSHNKFS